MAKLLVQLVMRDPGQLCNERLPGREFFTPLENVYLMTTFDCELEFEKEDREVKRLTSEACQVIPVLVMCLGQTIHTVVQQHLEVTEPQVGFVLIPMNIMDLPSF